MPWIKKPEETHIPAATVVAATSLFYSYKMKHLNFSPPATLLSLEEDYDTKRMDVHLDTYYKDTNIHMRSIRPEDHEIVQLYLNSQPLVRSKYANKMTVDAETTRKRVETLAARFDPKTADGCYMHGGFIVEDNETGDFLGMANSGFSGTAGNTEIAYLFRADAWSHVPANIVSEYNIPADHRLRKQYKGCATAVVSSLVQYTEYLKDKTYKIKGEDITGIRATAMVDNTGSCKALANVGFEPYNLDAKDEWGPELRYQLLYKLK